MNRLQKIFGAVSSKSWDDVFLRNIPLEMGTDVKDDPYSKSQIVYTCISTTARAISQVPLLVTQQRGDNWEKVKDDHEWQKLINRPNYLMDRYSFVEAIVTHLMLDGNVWVIPFPPSSGLPRSLWVIRKKHMEKITDNNGTLLGWYYQPSNTADKKIPLAFDEVVHIKFFNPDDMIYGKSPLDAGQIPLLGDYKAAKWNNNFFDEGAVPAGILSTEKSLSTIQRERIKAEFEERHKGYNKSHRTAVLEGGLKYEKVGLTQEDMQFLQLRRWSRDELLQIFGMKKSVISITDDLNFATAREQRREWWMGTNLPIMQLLLSSMNYTLYQDSGIPLKLMFDVQSVEALQEEFQTKVDTGWKLTQMGYTSNEINRVMKLGFEDKPWRDYWYMPLNLVPVNGEVTDTTQTPPELPPAEEDEEEPELIEESQKLLSDGQDKDLGPNFPSDIRQKRKEVIWKDFIVRTEGVEAVFEKKVKRVFFQMRQKALDMLNKKSLADIEMMDFPEERQLIERYANAAYQQALALGVDSVSREIGLDMSFSLKDNAAIDFMNLKPVKIREKLIDAVRDNIRNSCREGMKEGESVTQIANRIRNVFNVSAGRAKTIARTEVVGSSNFGRHIAIQSSGFQTKEWMTAMDERVRQSHKDMNGTTITTKIKDGVEQKWKVGAAELRYPGDWESNVAEEVINCRCIEVVVDEGGEGEIYGELGNELENENFLTSFNVGSGRQLSLQDIDLSQFDGKNFARHMAFGTKDPNLEYVVKLNGFSSRKTVIVNQQVFDRNVAALKSNPINVTGTSKVIDCPIYRGVAKKEFAVSFGSSNDDFYGRGTYGNGIYFSTNKEEASSALYKGVNGEVISATISKNAKIIDYEELVDRYMDGSVFQKEAVRMKKLGRATGNDILFERGEFLGHMANDPGYVAVLNGYDAIYSPRDNQLVILNKAILEVLK